MRRSNLATFFYLAVVFISGAVVGGFANRLYMAKPVSASRTHAEIRRQYLSEMHDRLHLSSTQVTQLQQIADTTGQHMHEARKTIEDEHVKSVIAMLDESQKAEYAKMREEREKARQAQAKKQ